MYFKNKLTGLSWYVTNKEVQERLKKDTDYEEVKAEKPKQSTKKEQPKKEEPKKTPAESQTKAKK